LRLPINVLVVDDSAFFRKIISEAVNADPDLTVVAIAHDGLDAVEKVRRYRPDVVTMDVNMPQLDGLSALREIMKEVPTPVVMLSSLTREGAEETIQSLQEGAVDFLCKPSMRDTGGGWQEELTTKVKIASRANLGRRSDPPVRERLTVIRPQFSVPARRLVGKVLVIGTSTGGPRALQEVLPKFPKDLPVGVLVVQHMPAGFTRTLAERLNSQSQIAVKEAANGDKIEPGVAYVAPGDFHLRVTARGEVALGQDPPIASLRPSVDAMFESVAEVFGEGTIAAVLTGMGSDGTRGARRIKAAGGRLVAEDQSTCVVYGMPRSVIEEGLADKVVPLPHVAEEMVKLLGNQ
jgi:two-component system chemotaxis response regulator CheB